MKNQLTALTLFISTLVLMTSCAIVPNSNKEFACPGMPMGVVCKDPMTVYRDTDSSELSDSSKMHSNMNGKNKDEKNENEINAFSKPAFLSNSGPMPVLEQPQVLRIWVAPWVDEKQTLNWPSYMFTEISPKKWSFGGLSFRGTKPLTPLVADFKSSVNNATNNAQNTSQTPTQPPIIPTNSNPAVNTTSTIANDNKASIDAFK